MSRLKNRIGAVIAASGFAFTPLILLLAAPAALAQTGGGCVDSPEAATVVLGLAGGGVAAWRKWRKRR